MIRSIISIAIALIFIASFTSRAACTVSEYCIDFESTNTLSLVAHGGTPSDPNSSKWSQVMDNEYTGINNFDGIDVEFWTSTEDTGATGQYDAPTLLPDFDAQDYDELIDGDATSQL